MLFTRSKKARDNIRRYIMEHYDAENYDLPPATTFDDIARNIWETMQEEKRHIDYPNDLEMFTDWAQGLPSILNTCYYYNRSAVDDLGAILEETDDEKARYTEPQAEKALTWLLFREISSTVRKER